MFDFSSFPTLVTDRVILRELRRGDGADVLVFRRIPRRSGSTPSRCGRSSRASLIDELLDAYATQSAVPWAVTLRESGRVVGLVGYNSWDRYHRRAEIGYDLARDVWGQGLATEALGAVVRSVSPRCSSTGSRPIPLRTTSGPYGYSAGSGSCSKDCDVSTPGRKTAPSTTERSLVC